MFPIFRSGSYTDSGLQKNYKIVEECDTGASALEDLFSECLMNAAESQKRVLLWKITPNQPNTEIQRIYKILHILYNKEDVAKFPKN